MQVGRLLPPDAGITCLERSIKLLWMHPNLRMYPLFLRIKVIFLRIKAVFLRNKSFILRLHCILADFKSRLLQVFPVSRVRFGNDLWFIYPYLGQYKAGRGQMPWPYGGLRRWRWTGSASAGQRSPSHNKMLSCSERTTVTQFTQFRNEGGDTVGPPLF